MDEASAGIGRKHQAEMFRAPLGLLLTVALTSSAGVSSRAEPGPAPPAGKLRSPGAEAPRLSPAINSRPGLPGLSPAKARPDDSLERLQFLCERLDARERNLRLWWGIWVGVHASMGAAQALVAGFADRAFESPKRARSYRNSLATGAITSGVGLVAALASYPAGARGCAPARRLRDGSTEGDARALALAEKHMRDTAKGLRFGRSWLTHLGGVVVNLAAGLVLWLAFDQPVDGAVQLLAGTAVAELQVWTQPTATIRDWDEYLRRFPAPAEASHQTLTLEPGWRLLPYPGGLGLQISY